MLGNIEIMAKNIRRYMAAQDKSRNDICNDGVCKKLVKHDAGITLQSLNPAYEPMFFSKESQESTPVTIWGKVVELRGRL